MISVLALAVAANLGAAQGDLKTGHWEKKPAALLFFDAEGDLVAEHHLGDTDDGKRSMGGLSPDGRLSWLFEKFGRQRRLRVFASDGKVLWESNEAEAPLGGGDPLLFSKDAETIFFCERAPSGWRVRARGLVGNLIMEAGPFAELHQTALTPDGRFAMARWSVPDQSATHTFLDLKNKARRDVPTDTFKLGQAKLEDDGKVTSGGKVALDLSKPAEAKK